MMRRGKSSGKLNFYNKTKLQSSLPSSTNMWGRLKRLKRKSKRTNCSSRPTRMPRTRESESLPLKLIRSYNLLNDTKLVP
jgi:hypothetical protein